MHRAVFSQKRLGLLARRGAEDAVFHHIAVAADDREHGADRFGELHEGAALPAERFKDHIQKIAGAERRALAREGAAHEKQNNEIIIAIPVVETL